MLKDGWKSVGKVFILALVLDVIYQFLVHASCIPSRPCWSRSSWRSCPIWSCEDWSLGLRERSRSQSQRAPGVWRFILRRRVRRRAAADLVAGDLHRGRCVQQLCTCRCRVPALRRRRALHARRGPSSEKILVGSTVSRYSSAVPRRYASSLSKASAVMRTGSRSRARPRRLNTCS